jgi:hypothetical protein
MTEEMRHKGIQRAITAVVLASYLLVLAMAASPALHQWLHDDADEADHHCAAVTAIHGQIDRTVDAPTLSALPALSWVEPRPVLYAVTIDRLFLVVRGLEHAPPLW